MAEYKFHKFNATKKKQFLEVYSEKKSITLSARAVGIERTTVYKTMKKDGGFKQAVEDIQNEKLDIVEDRLFALAVDGNLGAIIFTLTNERGEKWKNTQKVDGTHKLIFDPTQDIEIKITPKDLE